MCRAKEFNIVLEVVNSILIRTETFSILHRVYYFNPYFLLHFSINLIEDGEYIPIQETVFLSSTLTIYLFSFIVVTNTT